MAAGTSHTTISIKLNEQGFHDIFNKYYVTLCLFANQYTENQETSADIVQDSFAKLWQIREDFFYLHQVKAFLYTAVRNKALNELEHSKVVYEYAQNVIEKKKDSFFHDAIVEEETYRIVSEAINKLPDQMKAIMQLSLEGKKNAEIADRLNISTETVHTLKKIAYKKLRENLKDYYYFLIIHPNFKQTCFIIKEIKNRSKYDKTRFLYSQPHSKVSVGRNNPGRNNKTNCLERRIYSARDFIQENL